MIKDFLGIFRRFKTAGILNIAGLAVAFAAFAVIGMQLFFELGYDRHYKNAKYIFRVESLYPASMNYIASGAEPVGTVLKANCPLVKDYFHISGRKTTIFRLKEGNEAGKFKEKMVLAMPSMVDVLGMEMVAGDGRKALTEPDMLMIPESIARKWFGGLGALDRQVHTEDRTYTIAAVYRDLPGNTVFKNDCYTRYVETDNWSNWNDQLYVLSSTPDKDALQTSVRQVKLEVLDQIFEMLHKSEQLVQEGKAYLRVSPLEGIYYDNTVGYDTMDKGSRRSSLIMLGVGVLIILIAGINFVNFSLSQAPTRMKEVNTRKVLGAASVKLRMMLVKEAVVYSFSAFVVSVLFIRLLSMMTGLSGLLVVSPSLSGHWMLVGGVGVLSILIGLLAGIYPAFYMTSFEPAQMLKGSFVMTPKGVRLRNGLMAFQFTISIVLITCTLLMASQNRFMQNYAPGFSTENTGWFTMSNNLNVNREALADEMRRIPGVTDYTFGDAVPGGELVSNRGTEIDGEVVSFDEWRVYKNFLNFFDIQLVKGDTFSANVQENQLILNEMSVKKFPFMERYLGRGLNTFDSARLMGVVKDVNYLSLHNGIDPLAIIYSPGTPYNFMFLKLTGTNLNETVGKIKGVFERFEPDGIFEFTFVDQTIQQSYRNESRLTQLISLLGAIAIILALVGVYGLVVFNAQYKKKEIGIRKVNGATEKQIIFLLNRDFFRLLLISFLIACPVAWYAVIRWQEGFAYRTPVRWWMFLLAGFIVFLISLLTVSWRSWRAATVNPVEGLKE